MSDVIAAIDAAVGCQHCGRPLGDSPSDDFCSAAHQEAWHAARTVALAGYREPWDRPEDFPGIGSADTGMYRHRVPEPWRLPRETGDLLADWRAAQYAQATATTEVQQRAVALRIESLNARTRQAMEPLNAAMDSLRASFESMGRTIGKAMGQLRRDLARLATADVVVDSPAGDLRAHRLAAARRNRGSGPPALRMDGRRSR